MKLSMNLGPLLDMEVDGEDEHLDYLPDAPDPGSTRWLEIVDELCVLLASHGTWLIYLPLGMIDCWPGASITRSSAFGLADAAFLLEPPSVLRRSSGNAGRRAGIERCEVRRSVAAGLTEVIVASRSVEEARSGEPYRLEIVWEVTQHSGGPAERPQEGQSDPR
jgi:hypothetical protein